MTFVASQCMSLLPTALHSIAPRFEFEEIAQPLGQLRSPSRFYRLPCMSLQLKAGNFAHVAKEPSGRTELRRRPATTMHVLALYHFSTSASPCDRDACPSTSCPSTFLALLS